LIDEVERMRNIKVGFWHVPREYNELADKLAKEAARSAAAAVAQPLFSF